ncbi:MAG: hypothetical protein MUO82_10825 [Candidatus Thermoplasmatota archaeon]|nr:hypothetical protein [Candidatus Thermoplasmatota archaeon]
MKNDKTEQEINAVKQSLFGMNNNDKESQGEDLAKIIDSWLDEKYVHRKTRLNGNQVIILTIISSLADKYNVKCLKKLIDKFVTYKISEGGQSAKELVDILKNRLEVQSDDSLVKAIEPFIK